MPTGIYVRKPRPPIVCVCEVCSETFTFKNKTAMGIRTGRFCSKACSGKAHAKPERKVEMACAVCGASFLRRKDHLRAKNYCSKACGATGRRKPNAKWRDPQQIKEYMKVYQAENHSRRRIHQKKYRDTHRAELAARSRAERKSRKITRDKIAELLKRAEGYCIYCGLPKTLELDHFTPVVRGGAGTAKNFIPCCRSCNASKGARAGQDWIFERFGIEGLARTLCFMMPKKHPVRPRALYQNREIDA